MSRLSFPGIKARLDAAAEDLKQLEKLIPAAVAAGKAESAVGLMDLARRAMLNVQVAAEDLPIAGEQLPGIKQREAVACG